MILRWLRIFARVLALVWAGFWVFFGVASGIGEGGGFLATLLHTAMPGLVFLISALAAWKWEFMGGILLMGEGLAILIGYPLSFRNFPLATVIFVLLTMALPPLLSGALFLLHARRTRAEHAVASSSLQDIQNPDGL